MLKKILVVALMFVGMSFAQADAWDNSSTTHTSGAWGNNSTASTSETTELKSFPQSFNQKPVVEDLKYALALHPMILGIAGSQGMMFFFVTFEAGFGNAFSLITRPVFISGEWKGVAESGFGIVEGFRFYVSGKGHKGFYIEPEFQYVSIDASKGSLYATASGVGLYILAGYKVVAGHFVFGLDGGVGFNSASASSDGLQVKMSAAEGFGTDFNMYFGFAF